MGARMILRFFRSIWRNQNGSVLVETAFITPIAIMACLATLEFGSYMLLNQKIQNASMNVADLAAREEEIAVAQLKDLLLSVNEVMRPFDFSAGTVILTGVAAHSSGAPEVVWQYKSPEDSALTSEVGSVGQSASLNSAIVVRDNDSIVVAEVIYEYEKSLLGIISGRTIHKKAYYRARLGNYL